MGGTRRWGSCALQWWRHTGGTDPAIGFFDNPQRFEDQNILNVPTAIILYTDS